MGKVSNAVAWMRAIAADNSHGYDQTNRWGPDYDCSSLVISAYEQAGIPVKTKGATYTGNMFHTFIACGFKDVTSTINLSTGAGLIAGDVLLNVTHHTEMALGGGRLVGAHSNENGGITGGRPGDQSLREISEGNYYNYPWDYVLRYSESSVTKADVISANRFLTMDEMKINAEYIWSYLGARGWTLNAVAGMLGNMQTESTINPGIWQNLDAGNYSLGYGLVQWTPATKYTNWCAANQLERSDIDSALMRIEWELENGEQYYATPAYPLTFAEFKKSTKPAHYLGMAFLLNYERPANQDQPARGTQAQEWYAYLKDINPGGGGGGTGAGFVRNKRLSLLLLLAATKRRM